MKYLDAKLVEDLHKAVGMQMPSQSNNNIGDDIDDEIPEDFWGSDVQDKYNILWDYKRQFT